LSKTFCPKVNTICKPKTSGSVHTVHRARIRKRLWTRESIPRSRFCQPVRQIGLSYRPARLGSIPGLPKRFTNTGSGILAGAQGLIWWLGSWATVWLFNLSWRVSSGSRAPPPSPPPLSISCQCENRAGEEGGQRWHPPHLQASCPAVGLSCMYSKIGQPVTLLTYAQESRTPCQLPYLCIGISDSLSPYWLMHMNLGQPVSFLTYA
jgi:hypothetical protein